MKPTIVKIQYTNYSENAQVNTAKSEKQLLAICKTEDFISYQVIQQGDYQLKNETIKFETSEGEDSFLINANSIREATQAIIVGGTDWEDTKTRMQKVKENGIGYYVTNQGAKHYLEISDFGRFQEVYA